MNSLSTNYSKQTRDLGYLYTSSIHESGLGGGGGRGVLGELPPAHPASPEQTEQTSRLGWLSGKEMQTPASTLESGGVMHASGKDGVWVGTGPGLLHLVGEKPAKPP